MQRIFLLADDDNEDFILLNDAIITISGVLITLAAMTTFANLLVTNEKQNCPRCLGNRRNNSTAVAGTDGPPLPRFRPVDGIAIAAVTSVYLSFPWIKQYNKTLAELRRPNRIPHLLSRRPRHPENYPYSLNIPQYRVSIPISIRICRNIRGHRFPILRARMEECLIENYV
jgi:hypothetical protein